jgi:serine/threonine-protein kinase PknK
MVGSTSAPQLPGYRDLTPLGRGGYSEVYRAYQDQFDRWVAVKVLTFALTDDRAQRRFLRECRVAGRLSAHPNIVTVYDAGLSPDGRPYISMELFDRGSIADRLRGGGPFEVGDVLRIAIGLAGALETAHRAGVVHRDVKPANVLLASYGQPALTDFGLSILAERQEVSVGVDALTPYHAPPEVLERTTVTAKSDIYSLASTTYAMLAGRAPHQRGGDQDTMASLLLRILQMDIPPTGRADVPDSLDTTLRAALARDAHVRTPSALAFAQGMQQVQAELGLEVTQPIVMDSPQSTEVPAPGAGVFDASPGALTVPTDSPGPAVRPDATMGYGTAVPGDATIDRPGMAAASPASPSPAGPIGPAGPARPADAGVAMAFAPGRGPGGPGGAVDAGNAPGGVPGTPDPASWPSPPPGAYGHGHGPGPGPGSPGPAGPGTPGGPGPGGSFAGQPPPAGSGWDVPLDGDETVHRNVVRQARPAEPPPKPPSRLRRRLLVALLVLVLAGGGTGAYLATRGDKDNDGGRGEQTQGTDGDGSTTTEDLDLEVPTGLKATESPAGVQLDWDGENGETYLVLVLSTADQPQPLAAEMGTSRLVPAEALRPNTGYCFSVALLSAVNAAPEGQTAQAFSPPVCIRGASEDTIVTDSGPGGG